MSKRDIGQEILDGSKELKAHKAGRKTLRVRTLKEPSPPKIIRRKLQLSQLAFAGLMGVSLRTVQDWEYAPLDAGAMSVDLQQLHYQCGPPRVLYNSTREEHPRGE